eukprot:gene3481-4324_t
MRGLVLDVLRIVELSSVSSPSTSISGSEMEGERPEDEVVVDQDVWERITNLLPTTLEPFHDVRTPPAVQQEVISKGISSAERVDIIGQRETVS